MWFSSWRTDELASGNALHDVQRRRWPKGAVTLAVRTVVWTSKRPSKHQPFARIGPNRTASVTPP